MGLAIGTRQVAECLWESGAQQEIKKSLLTIYLQKTAGTKSEHTTRSIRKDKLTAGLAGRHTKILHVLLLGKIGVFIKGECTLLWEFKGFERRTSS